MMAIKFQVSSMRQTVSFTVNHFLLFFWFGKDGIYIYEEYLFFLNQSLPNSHLLHFVNEYVVLYTL